MVLICGHLRKSAANFWLWLRYAIPPVGALQLFFPFSLGFLPKANGQEPMACLSITKGSNCRLPVSLAFEVNNLMAIATALV
jgi:hypothetical protein